MPTVDQLQADLTALRAEFDALTAGLTATQSMLPADVTVNPDGSIDLNVRLRFLNPFDINTTGVGTITVLPDTSLAAFLPLLGRGDNGAVPTFHPVGIVHEVPHGTALPEQSLKCNLLDPGDPNASPPVGPKYQIELWYHAGPQGIPGTPVNLGSLGDVHEVSSMVPGLSIIYRTPDGASPGWYMEATRFVDAAVCTSFTAASNNAPNQVLGSLTLGAQGFPRRPWVTGAFKINPAADTTNGITHIDLIARMHASGVADPTIGGVIVAFGEGLDTNVPFIANLQPTAAAVGGSAIIPIGEARVIYLIAQQSNPTLSNWSTTMTHAAFGALGLALV